MYLKVLFFLLAVLASVGVGLRLQLDTTTLVISSATCAISVLILLEMTIESASWLKRSRGGGSAQVIGSNVLDSVTPKKPANWGTPVPVVPNRRRDSISQYETAETPRLNLNPHLHFAADTTTPGQPQSVPALNRTAEQPIRSRSATRDQYASDSSTSDSVNRTQRIEVRKESVHKPNVFNLGSDIKTWWERFQLYAECMNTKPEGMLNQLKSYMDDSCLKMVKWNIKNYRDVKDLRDQVIKLFDEFRGDACDHRSNFFSRKQLDGEDLRIFMTNLWTLAELAFDIEPHDNNPNHDALILEQFLHGINNQLIREQVKVYKPRTAVAALERACELYNSTVGVQKRPVIQSTIQSTYFNQSFAPTSSGYVNMMIPNTELRNPTYNNQSHQQQQQQRYSDQQQQGNNNNNTFLQTPQSQNFNFNDSSVGFATSTSRKQA